MILSFLFYAFLAYLLFRLVFNFILPVYRTTRKVKRTFREMKERMNQQSGQATPSQAPPPEASQESPLGEYIDFEEVKD
jgi:hypothetical protein